MTDIGTRTFDRGILDVAEPQFPLELREQFPEIRTLYRRSKKLRWNPSSDIPWSEVRADDYSPEVQLAARQWWSGRAWGEYGAISESPALQLRYQLDDLEPDLSLYWTIRTEEEAKHAEVSARFAELMGGYLEELPESRIVNVGGEKVSMLTTRARALDADVPVEATIGGLILVAEQISYDVFLALIGEIRNPAAKQIFRLICRDEIRHCEFGWEYMAKHLPGASAATKAAVRDVMVSMIENVEFQGYRVPWLSDTPNEAQVASERLVFEAGLGGTTPEFEWPVLSQSIGYIRDRIAPLGIELPVFRHSIYGTA